jgi:ubiquinone/menaquinone biosynthesis C-methylase UbiE
MAFADPSSNISELGIEPGMRVADFGSGTGHYALMVASAVGDNGKVYAVDVQQELLEKLKTESRKRGKHNIEVIWGNIEKNGGSNLREHSVDIVILSNILFQVEDKAGAIQEAKRILKAGGKLVLMDWSHSFGGLGPQQEDVVSKDEARALVSVEDMAFVKEFNAGDHHYGLVFAKR